MHIKKTSPGYAVQISAHRGASDYAPENTLEAFDFAAKAGFDIIITNFPDRAVEILKNS